MLTINFPVRWKEKIVFDLTAFRRTIFVSTHAQMASLWCVSSYIIPNIDKSFFRELKLIFYIFYRLLTQLINLHGRSAASIVTAPSPHRTMERLDVHFLSTADRLKRTLQVFAHVIDESNSRVCKEMSGSRLHTCETSQIPKIIQK